MPFKDPILHREIEVRLTPVEREVHGEMMLEHRAQKCRRCQGRHDLADGGFVCLRGRDPRLVLNDIRGCKRFALDENPDNWIGA